MKNWSKQLTEYLAMVKSTDKTNNYVLHFSFVLQGTNVPYCCKLLLTDFKWIVRIGSADANRKANELCIQRSCGQTSNVLHVWLNFKRNHISVSQLSSFWLDMTTFPLNAIPGFTEVKLWAWQWKWFGLE